jgi:hypothetical protein
MRMLLEHAIAQLPYHDVSVPTDCGQTYPGRACDAKVGTFSSSLFCFIYLNTDGCIFILWIRI